MKMRKELKIGVFVVTVLVASFFVINYLRGEDIFNSEVEVHSTYGNVEGLVASAPVYIKGYKAGKVTEVVYQTKTDDFKVVCSIKKKFRIPVDSRMVIYGVDIMGGKGVKIELGSSDSTVEDGGYLSSGSEAGLIDGLAAGISPIMSKLEGMLDSLSVTVSGVNDMLSADNKAAISATLAHLEKTTSDVARMTGMIKGRSSELDAFITNLSSFSEKLGSVAENADTVLTGVNRAVGTINSTDIEGVVSSLNTLLENMNDPDGTIGKLFVDNSMYDSVDSLLNNIDSLVKKIEENPKKYIKISVF